MRIGILGIGIVVLVGLTMVVAVGVVLFLVLMGRKSKPPHDENDD